VGVCSSVGEPGACLQLAAAARALDSSRGGRRVGIAAKEAHVHSTPDGGVMESTAGCAAAAGEGAHVARLQAGPHHAPAFVW
jgi:hypothetical protein